MFDNSTLIAPLAALAALAALAGQLGHRALGMPLERAALRP